MKFTAFLILFLLTGVSAQAQDYNLGEVTLKELEQKSHPLDPSAPAAILYSKGKVYMDDDILVTKIQVKIKIYSKEGYEWANKTIPYYSPGNGGMETVDIAQAATYTIVDGAVVKTKLKKESQFTEQVNKYMKLKKIMFPDVKAGCIVEYEYTIRSPFYTSLRDWDFQESIPVNYSQYTTVIPEYFVFNTIFRGHYVPKVTKTKANTEEKIIYTLENLPAMKDESYVNNIDNYTASIEHEIAMTQFPGRTVKTYSTNWEDVAKTIYEYEDFGPELKKTGYFEEDIKALIAGLTSPDDKVAAIFNYVKSRMTWNEYNEYYCDAGVKKAYKDKVGNVAEINLMLTAMFRYAGLDANPVLVSTRSNKIALFPSRTSFNYVIAAVQINNKTILFDATAKAAMPNILPKRAINWVGRLIKKDGTSLPVDLTPQQVSKQVCNLVVQLNSNGAVTGKARNQYFDQCAFNFRESYTALDNEGYKETVETLYKGIDITAYKVTNAKEYAKPLLEEYDFTYQGAADVIADKIYVSPLLLLTQAENLFMQEKRDYPVDFVFPSQHKYMVNIVLPDGYVAQSLPQPLTLNMEDDIGSFKYNMASAGRQIQITAILDINYATIAPEYYATLKDFFKKMIEKQNEKIVLVKA